MELIGRHYVSIILPLFFEAEPLTKHGSSVICLDWMANKFQSSFCLHLLGARIIGTCHHTQCFTWVLGMGTWVFVYTSVSP